MIVRWLLLRIVWDDLWNDWRLAFCTTIGMAAILTPLLVLAGLRTGVVESLRNSMLRNPHSREILSGGNREYSMAELDKLRRRPDVAYLIPRMRWTIPDVLMWPTSRPDSAPAYLQLIPSGPGDPLLPAGEVPLGFHSVVLSAAAAAELNVRPGAQLTTRIERSSRERGRESVELHLRVRAVAPAAADPQPAAFVSLQFATFKEDFQDFIAMPPAIGEAPRASTRTIFAGFRLYARRLEDVPTLDADLHRMGLDVNSQAAAKVADLLRLDRSLGALLVLVAALGGSGYLLALGAMLWAVVERKRTEFGILLILGMRRPILSSIPLVQAVLLAILGWLFAIVVAEAAGAVVNRLFIGMESAQPLCQITGQLAVETMALTVAGAAFAAVAAGARLSRIEPWEGIISL